MNVFWRSQFSHRLFIGAVAGATERPTRDHQGVRRPMSDPSTATGNCTQEQANHTAAATAVALAEEAATAAYEAWLDCEYGNGGGYKPTDNSHLVSETASIID